MGVHDRKLLPSSEVAVKLWTVPLVVTTGLNRAVRARFRPPGPGFQVLGVDVYALTVTGAVTVEVAIDGGTGPSVAAVADTAVRSATATEAQGRGAAGQEIRVLVTTDGTGAVTGGVATVRYRPRPLNGEAF